MSKIAATPDYVLMNFTTGHTRDLNDEITMYSINPHQTSAIAWTLQGSYTETFVIDDEDLDFIASKYVFNIEIIRDSCPTFYNYLMSI
jgi:hypothetical protein